MIAKTTAYLAVIQILFFPNQYRNQTQGPEEPQNRDPDRDRGQVARLPIKTQMAPPRTGTSRDPRTGSPDRKRPISDHVTSKKATGTPVAHRPRNRQRRLRGP